MELGRDNVHKLRHRHQQTEGWQRQWIIQDRIYHGPLWYFHIETPTLMISKTCFVILSNIVERTPHPSPNTTQNKQQTNVNKQKTNKQTKSTIDSFHLLRSSCMRNGRDLPEAGGNASAGLLAERIAVFP